MAKIRVVKDNMVLLDMEVSYLLSHLWLAATRSPKKPYTIETHALTSIEITQVDIEEEEEEEEIGNP